MIQGKTISSSSVKSCETPESRPGVVKFYLQCKRLYVFQLKLYIDAFRDVVLSALSLFAFLFDVVLMRDPQSGYFGKVLALGRRSERLINLFEKRSRAGQQADSVGRSCGYCCLPVFVFMHMLRYVRRCSACYSG